MLMSKLYLSPIKKMRFSQKMQNTICHQMSDIQIITNQVDKKTLSTIVSIHSDAVVLLNLDPGLFASIYITFSHLADTLIQSNLQ